MKHNISQIPSKHLHGAHNGLSGSSDDSALNCLRPWLSGRLRGNGKRERLMRHLVLLVPEQEMPAALETDQGRTRDKLLLRQSRLALSRGLVVCPFKSYLCVTYESMRVAGCSVTT